MKNVKNEIVKVHPTTHPAFLVITVNQDRHQRVAQESLALKWMTILKSSADTTQSTTQKIM